VIKKYKSRQKAENYKKSKIHKSQGKGGNVTDLAFA